MQKSIIVPAVIFATGLAVAAFLPLSADAASADQALSAAEAAIAEAKENHWIWRDTEKFYKEAQAAAEAGDTDKAISLADKARTQAELAVQQYNREEDMQRGL